MDTLLFCAMLGINMHFANEWRLVVPHTDRIMDVAWYRAARENNMDAQTFLKLHDKLVYLVLPRHDVDIVLHCQVGWMSVAANLHNVLAAGWGGAPPCSPSRFIRC